MVGQLVRARREALGYSQAQLAKYAQLSQTYISRLEKGDVTLPRQDTLRKFAHTLRVDISEFYRAAGIVDSIVVSGGEENNPLNDLIAQVETQSQTMVRLRQIRDDYSPEKYKELVERLGKAWATTLESMLEMIEFAGK